MATYSTPGVYVEERSIFPPSVAAVETAIPAFIGYTEKAMNKKKDDLHLFPFKVESLLEYERFFGTGPENKIVNVDLASDNTVLDINIVQTYYLYDSIRLFYENGGGKCYIVSVNLYDPLGAVAAIDFDNGLDALRKKDEPTMILFPDATKLTIETDLYDLQAKALLQCAELKDRVGVFDTYYSGTDEVLFDASIDTFRDHIGVNNLKYGAIYTPWLKSSLLRNFTYADIHDKLRKMGAPVLLGSLAAPTATAIKNLVQDYDVLLADRLLINTAIENLIGIPVTNDPNLLDANVQGLLDMYEGLINTFKAAPLIGAMQIDYRVLIDTTYELIAGLDDLALASPTGVATVDLKNQIMTLLNRIAVPGNEITNVVLLDNIIVTNSQYIGVAQPTSRIVTAKLKDVTAAPGTVWANANLQTVLSNGATTPDTLFDFNSTLPSVPAFGALTPVEFTTNMIGTEPVISATYLVLHDTLRSIVDSLESAMKTKEDSLYISFLTYKNIIDYINRELTILPPSGAIAGIYAYVDSTRGVWKPPANVSLTKVTSVTIELNDSDQEPLNIDVNSGKSINVIRPFTGKGILVWGARTLAGNDNDWRYVSVRRFCNMVEESVKKSTNWAVFEPNDANTWSRVKGMISNFLTDQWRDGALIGAKPEQSFYVKVGLGQTMTSQDILEGRMNVEIGMAVVRPAEFIILTFTQILPTAS